MKTQKTQITGHQGDVGFRSIKTLPENAVKIPNKPLALGEHSGHMHVLTGDVQLFEVDGRIIAAVGSDGARLQHVHESNIEEKDWTSAKELQKADHGSHFLPEGVYETWVQNAYNPFHKAFERVED